MTMLKKALAKPAYGRIRCDECGRVITKREWNDGLVGGESFPALDINGNFDEGWFNTCSRCNARKDSNGGRAG